LIIRVRSRIRGNSYQKEGIEIQKGAEGAGYRVSEIQGKKKHTREGDIGREGSAGDRYRVYTVQGCIRRQVYKGRGHLG
jgi:hypothetical protein